MLEMDWGTGRTMGDQLVRLNRPKFGHGGTINSKNMLELKKNKSLIHKGQNCSYILTKFDFMRRIEAK